MALDAAAETADRVVPDAELGATAGVLTTRAARTSCFVTADAAAGVAAPVVVLSVASAEASPAACGPDRATPNITAVAAPSCAPRRTRVLLVAAEARFFRSLFITAVLKL
jgi:hypothetical protein